jgi:hypothetical protein
MTIRTLPLRSLQPILRIPLPQTCLRSPLPPCLPKEKTPRPTITTYPRTFHTSSKRRQADFDPRSIERESDEVDVCIVGGGPAGLSAAIRLKQLAEKENREIRVLLLEKGSEMGTPYSQVQGVDDVRRTYSVWGRDTDECARRVVSELVGESSGTDYPCKERSNEVSDKGECNSDSSATTDA